MSEEGRPSFEAWELARGRGISRTALGRDDGRYSYRGVEGEWEAFQCGVRHAENNAPGYRLRVEELERRARVDQEIVSAASALIDAVNGDFAPGQRKAFKALLDSRRA